MTKPTPSNTPKILAAQDAEGRPDRAEFLRRMARPFVPRPWRQKAPGLTKSQTKDKAMKVNLRFLGLKPREEWKEQIAKEIDALAKAAPVSSADVVLEGRHESRPFFRLRALLAVPGPDFHAEGVDHTFAAALRKLVQELTRQIRHRKGKRLDRRRPALRNWAVSGSAIGGLAVGRR